MLNSLLKPLKSEMASRFNKTATEITTLLLMAERPEMDQMIPDFRNFNDYNPQKHPNKRVWLGVDDAMSHAREAVFPRNLLDDRRYVNSCAAFLQFLLDPDTRGQPYIEAAIYLLKVGVGFVEVVVLSKLIKTKAIEKHIESDLQYINAMTLEQKDGLINWLDCMDSYDEEENEEDDEEEE